MSAWKYIDGAPVGWSNQIKGLWEKGKLGRYLQLKYPENHEVNNDKLLFIYVNQIKNEYLKKSPQISKISFNGKLDYAYRALGVNSAQTRLQGCKLKTKFEIKISTVFKNAPERFLRMIVVHELVHLKERNHSKAFYNLCEHIEPEYHQLEWDTRLYLLNKALLIENS
jgi:UTP pyrophosphatase